MRQEIDNHTDRLRRWGVVTLEGTGQSAGVIALDDILRENAGAGIDEHVRGGRANGALRPDRDSSNARLCYPARHT
ncbi:MAG: hypothetical protein WA003_14790 [Desulfuromonadaceae bacterium]